MKPGSGFIMWWEMDDAPLWTPGGRQVIKTVSQEKATDVRLEFGL